MSLLGRNFYKQIFECYYKIKYIDGKEINEKRDKLIAKTKIAIRNNDREYQEVYSVVHEIRLFDFLREKNVGVVMQSDNTAGPDFECDFGYIECVSMTKGEGKNKAAFENVMSGTMNRYKAGESRITSVLSEKRNKYKRYLENKNIDKTKPRIIAVSTSMLSNEVHSDLSAEVMRKVLFGIGEQAMRFKKENGKTSISDSFYTYNATIKKQNGEFNAGYFWQDDFKDISAVILNHNAFTEDIDKDHFEIYLNPNANIPVDISKIQDFKYFYLQSRSDEEILFDWHNPKQGENK